MGTVKAAGFEGGGTGLPNAGIHQLFETHAERTPDAVALMWGERRLSYAELNSRANRLARHLQSLGVGQDARVAVCANRSIELVVALLAVLKTGGAYLALDPESPKDRLLFMMRDSGAQVVLVAPPFAWLSEGARHCVPLEADEQATTALRLEANLNSDTHAQQSAYICYTSGSTGVPKGVDVLHVGVVRLVWGVTYVQLDPSRVVLHAAPAAFDATTFEVWGPLLNGGCCALLPEAIPTAASLRQTIQSAGVTTAFLTTALVNAVVDEDPTALSGLEELLFGGEAVSVKHVVRLQRACPGLNLIHCYGPTETTTFATAYRIRGLISEAQATIPLGRPIENTTIAVLSPEGLAVPANGVGELFIGGCGVARGYVNRPELTAQRFLPDLLSDVPGAQLYRTGDVVRLQSSGDVEFIGRLDHQVKIRGHRIELGEIEAKLVALPSIKEAVVLCREDNPGDKRLVAYVVPEAGDQVDVVKLRQGLTPVLPHYMVPQFFVVLERFPLSPNGKIHRAALPVPTLDIPPRNTAFVPPRRQVERELAELWGDLLSVGTDGLGVWDDFFEVGGNSLLAVRMLARIRKRYDIEFSVTEFFREPTVARLALGIEGCLYLQQGEAFGEQSETTRVREWF